MQGRSAILDVHAVDSTKKEFDIEIQRKDAGAGAKRARHNSSLLDAHILKPGDDTEDIPDSKAILQIACNFYAQTRAEEICR